MLTVGASSNVSYCQFDIREDASVTVGEGCVLRGRVVAMPGCTVTIGDGNIWNRACHVRASEETNIVIGDGCLFSDVTIETSDLHSVLDADTGVRINPAQDVVVGDRCWLGSGVLLLPGARLSDDTVVGARALVKKHFPPNVVIAGVPARIVKENVTWVRERI